MQGETAARREGVKATVLYTQTSGPLKNRHARALEIEADGNGLILRKTKNPPLHGKFVTWDDDDIVVTSLNWASAASDPDFPWADIGIHIKSKEIGAVLTARLDAIFPELREVRGASSPIGSVPSEAR
jgi:cardiolipin synthase A/B